MRRHMKVARIKAQMTQQEAADAAGISEGTYGKIERGRVDGGKLIWRALEQLYGIPADKLREDDGRELDRMRVTKGGTSV